MIKGVNITSGTQHAKTERESFPQERKSEETSGFTLTGLDIRRHVMTQTKMDSVMSI